MVEHDEPGWVPAAVSTTIALANTIPLLDIVDSIGLGEGILSLVIFSLDWMGSVA